MKSNDPRYASFVRILREEMKPATGCTEPIAIAYAAAVARRVLGAEPDEVRVGVSGNILKNAKSVLVPNTNGRKGIEAACAIGLAAGDADRELEVIARVDDAQRAAMEAMLAAGIIQVELMPEARVFDIVVDLAAGAHTCRVRIADRHANVVLEMRDGKVLRAKPLADDAAGGGCAAALTIADIYDFASTCDLADVRETVGRQIECTDAIAREGLAGAWGACVGRTLMDASRDEDQRAAAYAAAGSDARMGGCEKPVVINSGSGNQGITVSAPLLWYARETGADGDALIHALVLSNLVAIHEKAQIGCLSAYCGAVTAGCAAAAGVAFLQGGDLEVINHTIVNGLAILSGTICDGAKPSCAAKIASAVEAGLLGYRMTLAHRQFYGGDGIVRKGVENTIHNVGCLARDGMTGTDREILRIMTDQGGRAG